MKNKKLSQLILTALFAAMTAVATTVLPFPVGTGYVHPGDSIILLCAWLLGPIPGAIAGALGAGLADALLGYTVYIPATVVIKILMGLCAGGLFTCIKNRTIGRILGGVVAGLVMVLGYFLYEALLYGLGGALPGIYANLLQASFAVVSATVVYPLLSRLTNAK